MRVGVFSLALLGSSASGCLRGTSRGVIGEPSAEPKRDLWTPVTVSTPMKPSKFDAHSKEDESDKIMSIYQRRLEGRQALKMACASEKEFAKCKLRKGFGSALNLADCLIKEGGEPISDRCARGIEEWQVLRTCSQALIRSFPRLLKSWARVDYVSEHCSLTLKLYQDCHDTFKLEQIAVYRMLFSVSFPTLISRVPPNSLGVPSKTLKYSSSK